MALVGDGVGLLLDSLAAASTLSLRATAVYFTQFLPLGPRFLPIIYGSFCLYLAAIIAKGLVRARPSKPASELQAVLFGFYEPRRFRATLCTILINAVAFSACWDFVFRAHVLNSGRDARFARTGYTDSSSARIVVRAPEAAAVEIQYREDRSITWMVGSTLSTKPDTDHVATFVLDSLQPETTYQYRTNASHHGTFRTSPENPKRWTMVSSSCLKPGFPYRPLRHALRIPGLEHLSNFVASKQTSFMLFLGDFIYIDLPYRFGFSNSDYRDAYRQVYASPSWTPELLGLPFLHTYDDHEFSNDWAANTTGLFLDAVEPYVNYHGKANPRPYEVDRSWYTFQHGDVDFFVADARRFRSDEAMVDGPSKTMLGEEQLQELHDWLDTGREQWKIFVTSVPFTKNWRGPEAKDSWAGYLWERQMILEHMWKVGGVVVISGDRHEHATTEFPSPDGKSSVIEFSTSPLSQFYQPFERMYQQVEDTDIQVNYHPWGVSKFGAFTFDTSSGDRHDWSVTFELVVDGKKAWQKVVQPF